jgi:hypothetical protein
MDPCDGQGKHGGFRAPRAGEQVNLWLRSDLPRELALPSAAARIHELQARGIDHVAVQVMKVPLADVLGAEDAVKVAAPQLTEAKDASAYVRVKFLDLPAI